MFPIRILAVILLGALVAAVVVREDRSNSPAAVYEGQPTVHVDSAMTGKWCGTAQVHNSWVSHRTLSVHVDIAADGSVHGRVGDATLSRATFHRNRGAIGRALDIKTDWIVEGELDGFLIAAEQLRRPRVKVPLNRVTTDSGSEFRGGVNSSGLMFGDASNGVVAASRLVLRRCVL